MHLRYLGIPTRNSLGHWLNHYNLTQYAVEVGTHRGDFAHTLLSTWKGRLVCVDPYEDAPDYDTQLQYLWGGAKSRNEDAAIAFQKLQDFHRAEFAYMTSQTAAGVWESYGTKFDFVYLDGNHREPYVTQDLNLWWPLVKPGGLLAGHDFISMSQTDSDEYWPRYIQPAVMNFAQQQGLNTVYLIPEPDGLPWSYALRKP